MSIMYRKMTKSTTMYLMYYSFLIRSCYIHLQKMQLYLFHSDNSNKVLNILEFVLAESKEVTYIVCILNINSWCGGMCFFLLLATQEAGRSLESCSKPTNKKINNYLINVLVYPMDYISSV